MSGIYQMQLVKELCHNNDEHECCAMCGNCQECTSDEIDGDTFKSKVMGMFNEAIKESKGDNSAALIEIFSKKIEEY